MSTIRSILDDDDAPKRSLHLWEVLRRRRGWWALPLLGCSTATVAVSAFLPNVYRSSAIILIERQQIPDELVRSTVTSGLDVRLQMLSQEILGRSRLEGLVAQFGLYPELRGRIPTEGIVERMRTDIQVEMRGEQKRSDRTTVAFSVSYRGAEPAKVAAVANAIASFYIEENLKARERQATGTAEFLRNQLEQLKTRLAKQEAQVSAFKEKNLGELPQQLDANLKTLEQLNAQLRLNSDNQAQVLARRATLETQLGEALGQAESGPDAVAARLSELRRQLATLRTQYTDQYPDVVRVKTEIEKLEALVATGGIESSSARRAAALNPQVLQLRRSLGENELEQGRLRSEAERVRGMIALYQKRVEAAPRREQEFQVLSREYQSTQEQYRSLVQRQSEAELAESMEQRQKGELFRVIEPAVANEQPAAPKRGRLLVLGFLLSLAISAALVFACEAFDTSIHTRADVEMQAALPVLASIPLLTSTSELWRKRLRFAFHSVVVLVALCLIVGSSYALARGNNEFAVWVSR